MKIQPYIEKLNSSEEYKKFIGEHKDAFLVAGFFVLDLEMGKNIHQIDFYVPSEKKFAAFTLDEGVQYQLLDTLSENVPEHLDMKTNIDLDALEGILEDEMKNRNITADIKKIIVVLQNVDGKKIWNINSVLSGMEILKAHVEDSSKTVLKMEKTSFMDIMKKIPPSQLKQFQQMQSADPQAGSQVVEEDPEVAEEELEKLDKLEEQIEKEKARLKKKVIKNVKSSKKS